MPNQEQEQEQQQEQDQEEDEPTDVGLSSAGGDAATGDETVGGDLLGDSPRPKPKRTARLRARIWKSLTCSTRSCQSFRRLGPGRNASEQACRAMEVRAFPAEHRVVAPVLPDCPQKRMAHGEGQRPRRDAVQMHP
ncbi:hypothetical protein SNK04_014304 [Fusarium graminearum]